MPKRSSSRKGDLNQIAARVVSAATSHTEQDPSSVRPEPKKNPAAVALGRLGGKKGGKARAESLSPSERKRIASEAARARWDKVRDTADNVRQGKTENP